MKSDPIDLRKHGQEQRRATQGKKAHTDGTGMGRWGDLSRPQNRLGRHHIGGQARPRPRERSPLGSSDGFRAKGEVARGESRSPNQRKPTTNWEKAWGGAEVVKGESLLNI